MKALLYFHFFSCLTLSYPRRVPETEDDSPVYKKKKTQPARKSRGQIQQADRKKDKKTQDKKLRKQHNLVAKVEAESARR